MNDDGADPAPESDAGLAGVFAELARALHAEPDMDGILRRTVLAAVRNVPGAEFAGIAVLGKRSITSVAASDALVGLLDQAQYDAAEGPCLAVVSDERSIVLVDDLAKDRRWPRFAARAAELGVSSVLSFQLSATGDAMGTLNLYARTAHAFTEESVLVGTMLSAHAAVAMDATVAIDRLHQALAGRDVIGQAKGILMERYQLSDDQAFDLLIAASQHTNRKLHDVAADLVATGALPDPRGAPSDAVPSDAIVLTDAVPTEMTRPGGVTQTAAD